MERVDRIANHPLFRETLSRLETLEKDRIFCCHGLDHLLAVARLASLWNEEENLGFSREMIYAAALLHDLGREEQYRNGTPHEIAGERLAMTILPECGFFDSECRVIVRAIGSHRSNESTSEFGALLYRADKKSRSCYWCKAADQCNWPMEKRNLSVI